MKRRGKVLIGVLLVVLFVSVSWYFGLWSWIVQKPPKEKIDPYFQQLSGKQRVYVDLVVPSNPFLIKKLENVMEVKSTTNYQNMVIGVIDVDKVDELAQYKEVSYIKAIRKAESKFSRSEIEEELHFDDLNYNGRDISVAVLDTGINCDVLRDEGFEGLCEEWTCTDTGCHRGDDYPGMENSVDRDHATAVAQILTRMAPGIDIYSIHNCCGQVPNSNEFYSPVNGVEQAIDLNVDVIQQSLGLVTCPATLPEDSPWTEELQTAVEEGIIVSQAAGNSGPTRPSICVPGDAPNVITVGGLEDDEDIWSGSSRGPSYWETNNLNYGPKPEVTSFACVSDIVLSGCGTSFATPQVSALSAILLEANPNLTPEDAKRIIVNTAKELPEGDATSCESLSCSSPTNCDRYSCECFDFDYGNGEIQPSLAVRKAEGLQGQVLGIKNIFK